MIPDETQPGDLIEVNGQTCEITFIFAGRRGVLIRYPGGKTTAYWPSGWVKVQHRALSELEVPQAVRTKVHR
jgi:hypothetical protein